MTNETLPAVQAVDLDMRDEKGRAIGYQIRRYGARTDIYSKPGETLFVATVQPTRNGKKYGAIVPWSYASTAEGLEAVIAQKIEEGRKRYAKKFGTQAKLDAATATFKRIGRI